MEASGLCLRPEASISHRATPGWRTGCAIGYLVARGAVASDQKIHLRQGVEIARPSDLFLAAKMNAATVGDVRVAGSTVLVAAGRLFLP